MYVEKIRICICVDVRKYGQGQDTSNSYLFQRGDSLGRQDTCPMEGHISCVRLCFLIFEPSDCISYSDFLKSLANPQVLIGELWKKVWLTRLSHHSASCCHRDLSAQVRTGTADRPRNGESRRPPLEPARPCLQSVCRERGLLLPP